MIGLTLGSGGAIGLGSIGVISYLQNKGVEFSEIAGSSMGALVGAYLSVHGEVETLKDIATSQKKKDLLKLIDLNNPQKSIIRGKKVEAFVRRHLKAQDFKQCRTPLTVIATDILHHKPQVFRKGDLIKALMGSISIPGIFPPVKYRKTFLVDGGLSDPLPLKYLNTKNKIAIDFAPMDVKKNSLSIVETLHLSFSAIMKYVEKDILNSVDKNTEIVKVNKVFKLTPMLSFHKAEDFIKEGERAARKSYKRIKRLIE